MKHKHYDMIAAKAANMDLAVFIMATKNYWQETQGLSVCEDYTYFLCLPQHKDACLHWLNGGEVQDFYKDEWVDCGGPSDWHGGHMMMDDEAKYRIKPNKEKRWIGASKSSCHTTGHHKTKEEAINITESQPWASAYAPWQFIEIEVEV